VKDGCEFQNKVIIVTGASLGIGKAVALRLLEKGAKVVGFSRNEEMLKKLNDSCFYNGQNFLPIRGDVSRADEVKKLVEETVQRFNEIHALINNAGVYPVTPFLDMSEEEWDQVVGTNLKGAFLCSKAVTQEMVSKGVKGQIVNIGSTVSLIARPGTAHYASSKAGLNMFTKVLAVELAPYGIRVNAVLPGVIATERVKDQLKSDRARIEHDTKVSRIPFGHEGSPRDIADAVLHLLSEKARYSTGSLMVVDGGYSLGIPAYQA
jgi:3-oxoacyl-[acyl-carrier protein] reductase